MATRKYSITPKLRGISKGYRSGLEESISEQLNNLKIKFEYESFKVPYIEPATAHTYKPDFRLPNGIIVESKGIFTLEDRKKHLWVKEQHPELDIRFVFSRSKSPITKGSKTTYGMWCEKNGFQYADKLIPVDWIKEQPK